MLMKTNSLAISHDGTVLAIGSKYGKEDITSRNLNSPFMSSSDLEIKSRMPNIAIGLFLQSDGDSFVERIKCAKYDYSGGRNIVVYHDLLSGQDDYLI